MWPCYEARTTLGMQLVVFAGVEGCLVVKRFLDFEFVVFLFVFDNYCLTMD